MEAERIRCDQCGAAMINGVFCHEQGCPNQGKSYYDGLWIKYVSCPECDDDVKEGEVCDCQQPQDSKDSDLELKWTEPHHYGKEH